MPSGNLDHIYRSPGFEEPIREALLRNGRKLNGNDGQKALCIFFEPSHCHERTFSRMN